ncbi:MAG: thiamine phosphate synthase [Prolixibacteraceae bacterium]|jgi:thiamine-phosphate pyrophosphorylase|nr:thiamine phosphate synthase [Prolixibacteraceae bacterium]
MQFIAITYPEKLKNEGEIIDTLFREDLPCLHLRKPGMNAQAIASLLNVIDNKFHHRIVVNDHIELADHYDIKGIHFSGRTRHLLATPFNGISKSCSCHSFSEIPEVSAFCDYVFLSPVFNSISKNGYQSAFNYGELKNQLSKPHPTDIIALGGISTDKISQVCELKFDGAAILGGLWNEKSTMNEVVSNYNIYKKQLEQCDLM